MGLGGSLGLVGGGFLGDIQRRLLAAGWLALTHSADAECKKL